MFGGPSAELGEKLYQFLFHNEDTSAVGVDQGVFVTAMTKLHTALSEGSKEICYFFFSLFVNSKGSLELGNPAQL